MHIPYRSWEDASKIVHIAGTRSELLYSNIRFYHPQLEGEKGKDIRIAIGAEMAAVGI